MLAADRVEQHLHRRREKPSGEHPSVVGQQLLRRPGAANRRPQPLIHQPGPLPRHQLRRHARPGMIIQPGQRLRLAAVGDQEPAHGVPSATARSAGPAPTASTPACGGAARPARPTRPAADTDTPTTRSPPGRRRPSSVAIRSRPPRPMLPPGLQHRRLHHRRHLMRTPSRSMRPIDQPLQAAGLILAKPGMQSLPTHPDRGRRLLDRPAVLDHRQHSQIALLRHAQLPHTGVSRISRSRCQPSTETLSPINRSRIVKPSVEGIQSERWAPWDSNPQPAD